MDTPVITTLLTLGLTAAAIARTSSDAVELVQDPGLSSAPGVGPGAVWSPWLPDWESARCDLRTTHDGLRIEAPGRPYAVGGVEQRLEGITGGQAYAIEAECELDDVPFAYQTAVVRLTWTRNGEAVHPAGALLNGPSVKGHRARFGDVIVAPAEADGASLRLEVRWPQGGSVLWQRAGMKATDPPAPRKVRIGTVYLRPADSTPERNMDLWCEQIDEAGRLGLDIVCLGEAILMVGTGAGPADIAEPIPGPSTERLGEAARRNRLWVVAGLMERDGDLLYNTAVLLDREGKLAGTYRKVHLPREEWNKGVTPGLEYPVFRTDFGTIAVQICYDWFFPEPATIFAHEGAEILFAPTWGNTLPDWDGVADGETVFRVRARDNGLYMVPCVYDGNSMVIDPMGRILASNKGETGVFWAEVDLNTREPLPWVGYWRAIGPRDRMPSTYDSLLSGPPEPNY